MTPTTAITTNPLVRFFIAALPRRMKRIVFLASFAALVRKTTEPDKTLISKLNDVLALASTSEAALLLPFYHSPLIWPNRQAMEGELHQLETSCPATAEAHTCVETIVQGVPGWFCYDCPAVMASEISTLFHQCQAQCPQADTCVPAVKTSHPPSNFFAHP